MRLGGGGAITALLGPIPSLPSGWSTLPLGAGGLVTGLHIANDGSMVCRTDVGNIYRWSGKSTDYADATRAWLPLLHFSSLGVAANVGGNNVGGWEHVLAPTNSSVHLAIFSDMTGISNKAWLWYSLNSGQTWNQTNISFLNGTAQSNGSDKISCYKIAIDPANANIAYCGVPNNSGNSAGVYTSLNKAGGSTLATFSAVVNGTATLGAPTSGNISCGLAIDPSLGTTTIGGQTVTKHIILPIGGVGIYESTDGGNTFTEIAVAAFGTSNFNVVNAGFNSGGVYYAVVSSATAFGLWRYVSGTWTNISPSGYSTAGDFTQGTFLIIDPRSGAGNQSYLSISGPNGIGQGFTSTNANSGTPTWTGSTGGEFPYLQAATYDIPYLNFIFGQQSLNAFADASAAFVDNHGTCFFGGNQSLWYMGTSQIDPTPNGLPSYQNTSPFNTYWWSMGRGQEATVSLDALVPPNGQYPILATQDLGNPSRGTFTTYPKDLAVHFEEYTCSSLEYAASDPGFIVANTAAQTSGVTAWCYSKNYGADGTWIQLASQPASLWNGSGAEVTSGQLVAVDHDHWFGAPSGSDQALVPGFTANATGASSWSLCSGLPSASWMMNTWVFGDPAKPFAVGYGPDLGTVWAVLLVTGSSTATLYRSTDSGATFSSIATWTISVDCLWPFCLSVPGHPGELWVTAGFSGGSNTNLFHITNANTASATVTAVAPPALAALPLGFTLGAPATPGGYPTIYLLGNATSGAAKYLYQGTWNGSSMTWTLLGRTGTSADLPKSCQLCGIQSIRGDPNVYQRLYASSNQSGFAFYTP